MISSALTVSIAGVMVVMAIIATHYMEDKNDNDNAKA